ncbi:hypothetical protein EDD11_010272 [Mortierella claussenii]|nr:hypothetical protein EDD11_010272 [Mortierella claussenii]
MTFGFLQFYLYTIGMSPERRLPRFNAIDASLESRRPLRVPITIVTAVSGNHACALEAFLYHINTTFSYLHTSLEKDQRQKEERIRRGIEYVETSPDLENIRKKKRSREKKKLGNTRKMEGGSNQSGGGGAKHDVARQNSLKKKQTGQDLGSKADDNGSDEDHRMEHHEHPFDSTDWRVVVQDAEQESTIAALQMNLDIDGKSSNDHDDDNTEYEIRPRVIVYSMGMGPTKRKKRRFKALLEAGYIDEAIDFQFDQYPAFWQLGTQTRGEYGWKAGMIGEISQRVLSESSSSSSSSSIKDNNNHSNTNSQDIGRHESGIVLWLDSGDRISVAFLRWLPTFMKQYGLWTPQSQDDMRTWTHPGLLQHYHDSWDNFAVNETNCNGAAVAFDVLNTTVREGVMKEWIQCAKTQECIAPKGSSRENHRQDQAALTYLIKTGMKVGQGREELCHGFPDAFGVQVNQDRYCKEEIAANPYRVVSE